MSTLGMADHKLKFAVAISNVLKYLFLFCFFFHFVFLIESLPVKAYTKNDRFPKHPIKYTQYTCFRRILLTPRTVKITLLLYTSTCKSLMFASV